MILINNCHSPNIAVWDIHLLCRISTWSVGYPLRKVNDYHKKMAIIKMEIYLKITKAYEICTKGLFIFTTGWERRWFGDFIHGKTDAPSWGKNQLLPQLWARNRVPPTHKMDPLINLWKKGYSTAKLQLTLNCEWSLIHLLVKMNELLHMTTTPVYIPASQKSGCVKLQLHYTDCILSNDH